MKRRGGWVGSHYRPIPLPVSDPRTRGPYLFSSAFSRQLLIPPSRIRTAGRNFSAASARVVCLIPCLTQPLLSFSRSRLPGCLNSIVCGASTARAVQVGGRFSVAIDMVLQLSRQHWIALDSSRQQE